MRSPGLQRGDPGMRRIPLTVAVLALGLMGCEFEQRRRQRGEAKCKLCGQWWPADHLETDSGDCITCEDMRQLEGNEDD